MKKIFIIIMLSISLYATTSNKSKMQMELMDSVVTLATKNEKDGLNKIKNLIKTNPVEFKNTYHKLFLNPSYRVYTSILKQYGRFVDITTFKVMAKKTGILDSYMQDSALTYVFFSSKQEFMKELSPFVYAFEELMHKNKLNNTKTNQELLALFKANILISESRDTIAYRIIQKNQPYHAKALQAISYFVNIQGIPLFKNRSKLLEAIGVNNLTLNDSVFEHKPKYLFDFQTQKRAINYISPKEVKNILEDVNNYLISNKSITKPLRPYSFSVRDIKSEGDFVKLETVLVYDDGNYVETDFVGDSVFVLCLEKVSDKWHVIYDLSRNDVPSDEEMEEIRKEFPKRFPSKLLSPFWKRKLLIQKY